MKKFWFIVLCVIIIFGIFFAIPRPKSVSENRFIIGKNARPLLIAHGGGNQEFPDNTLEAYYNAYSIDPDCMLETDVSLTKDGVIILSHDTTLDRKTNVTGNIIDWNYSDLISQKVDFNYENEVSPESNGYKVSNELITYKNFEGKEVTPLDVKYPYGVSPRDDTKFLATTLEELIKDFPNNTINVEIKQDGDVGLKALDTVIKLLSDLDVDYNTFNRIVLASFHTNVYNKIKEYQRTEYPNLKFSPNADGIILLYLTHWIGLDFIYHEPVTVLQIPQHQSILPLNFKFFIDAAHRHNIAVHYWTIDDENDMRILAKRGADGIMTDLPSRLKSVLDELY